MILVTAATGNVERTVSTQLIAAGEPVPAFSRRPTAFLPEWMCDSSTESEQYFRRFVGGLVLRN
jgi:hypothetical protein